MKRGAIYRTCPCGECSRRMSESKKRESKENPLSDWTGQIALAGALLFAGVFYWQVNKKTND